ncbi:MAG TPA: pitrilysin family protein [Parasegetibacter sp.]
MLNRNIAPDIVDAVDFKLTLPACKKWTLKNGVEVYAYHGGSQEVMMAEWVFYSGNWYEDQNLVASATNFLLKNGTATKSAFEISEHFDYYGAYLNRSCYNEVAVLTLHCLSKHIEHLLPAVQDILSNSTFPEEELEIYKQNMKQRLLVNLQKCEFVANRLIDESLYGFHHPYGRYSSILDFDALNREQLQAFYKNYYQHGKCILFVAGWLPENLEELLNKHFGDLPLNQRQLIERSFEITPASQKKVEKINDPNGVQAAIRVASPFPNRHHPDFKKAVVLNNILGGFFGSRLMSNIREDKGYTYGIYSYIQNHIQQSSWVISTEAGRDVAQATLKEIYHEMNELREEPVDQEELSLVKNYMIGTILGSLDGPFQIIGRWKNLILHGMDENYFYESLNTIREISAEEIHGLAIKYLDPDLFYEVVVI